MIEPPARHVLGGDRAQPQRALQVDRDRLVEQVLGDTEQRRRHRRDAGVVDEHVDATELGDRRGRPAPAHCAQSPTWHDTASARRPERTDLVARPPRRARACGSPPRRRRPRSANPSAIARPRPLLPPVMTTTLSSQSERRRASRRLAPCPGVNCRRLDELVAGEQHGRPAGRSTRGPACSTRRARTSRSCPRARWRASSGRTRGTSRCADTSRPGALGVALDHRRARRASRSTSKRAVAARCRAAWCRPARGGRSAPTRGRRADRRSTPSPSRRPRAVAAARRCANSTLSSL